VEVISYVAFQILDPPSMCKLFVTYVAMW